MSYEIILENWDKITDFIYEATELMKYQLPFLGSNVANIISFSPTYLSLTKPYIIFNLCIV